MVDITEYKNYEIITDSGIKKGIFFRSPLQYADFSTDIVFDTDGDIKFSAWKYLDDIQNPIRRFYEILIGNGKIVRKIKDWSTTTDFDWAGFEGITLCSPIYFKRKYRKLILVSCDSNSKIQHISSYGYESEFNTCGGACANETTIIHFSNGRKIKLKRKDYFHFTYEHIIKKIIDSGEIK